MKLSLPRTDVKRASEGVWIPFDAKHKFRIARSGNPSYRAELQRVLAEDLPTVRHQKSLTERQEEAQLRAAAKCILTGWEGLTDPDTGEEIPYSVELAYELLSDPHWTEVAEFVWSVASDAAVFREIEVKQAEGN